MIRNIFSSSKEVPVDTNKEISTAQNVINEVEKKAEFLQSVDKKIEKLCKEAVCIKELNFSILDNSFNLTEELTAKIASIMQVEKCAIYSIDVDNDEFILESPIYGQNMASLKFSKIKIGSVLEKVNETASFLLDTKNTQSIFLQINERNIGILSVANKTDNSSFNDEDIYFLELCAKQSAIIIENNKLYREMQAQAARERIINRINNEIRSSLDLNTILTTAVNEVGTALKVSIANVIKFIPEKDIGIVTHEYNSTQHTYSNSVGTIIPLHGSAITEYINQNKKTVVINDTLISPYIINYPATKHRIVDTIQAKSVLSVPIIFENDIFGLFSLNQCDRVRKWTRGEIQTVEHIASQLGVAINHASLMEKIRTLAVKDELTGLLNRRNFYERFICEIERIKRHNGHMSFAIFDVDHFKLFNDNWGHLAGDYVLKEIGKVIMQNVRKSDIAARYGGEEFAVILPQAALKDGYDLLERLRKTIQDKEFNFQGNRLKVTISGGIIQVGPLDMTEFDLEFLISDSVNRADNLLYQAKKIGRNRICGYTEEQPEIKSDKK